MLASIEGQGETSCEGAADRFVRSGVRDISGCDTGSQTAERVRSLEQARQPGLPADRSARG